jgi:hypothetical protein
MIIINLFAYPFISSQISQNIWKTFQSKKKKISCWDLFGVHQLKEPPMKNTLGCLEIQS